MRRPRVKPEHAPYRISGDRIRIGGLAYGIAAEVKDPTGSIWTLLTCMDGSRDRDAIVAEVLRVHPRETTDAVSRGLDAFLMSGYVEDVGAPDPPELTELEKERYSRGRAYYRWLDLTPRANSWEPQMALRRSRVTVVGLGGTGGVAAVALAASGVGRLHCVDYDTVELSNLNRQVLYTERDVGEPKLVVAVRRLRQLNSTVEVSGDQRQITGVEDLREFAQDCDVLLLAADQPADIRVWANRACIATGTPWVAVGYHGPQITAGVYRPGTGPCFECLLAAETARRDALGVHPGDTQRRADAVANAVAAPSAGISGYLAAHCVIALLTGVPPVPVGRIHGWNLAALDATVVTDDPRRPDCDACGDPA